MPSDAGPVSWDDSVSARELHDHLELLKEKYDRLFASHQKLLKINQGLEDKLLRIVDRYESERTSFSHQISSLTSQLHELKELSRKLTEDNERYRSDISLATQLLHCNPTNFTPCKLNMLPPDLQEKAKTYLLDTNQRTVPVADKQPKVIRVPISAFPPTTVIYSVPSSDENQGLSGEEEISAAVMARILEERQREKIEKDRHKKITPVPGLPHSRSMTFLDGLKSIDQGTQTYSSYIGETDRTRQKCVFCHGQQQPVTSEAPPLIIFTETETNLHSVHPIKKNGHAGLAGVQQRRRGPTSSEASSVATSAEQNSWLSIETDI